jgi:hypothetical protein
MSTEFHNYYRNKCGVNEAANDLSVGSSWHLADLALFSLPWLRSPLDRYEGIISLPEIKIVGERKRHLPNESISA